MGLADKIRKARESTVEVGGYTFTVRRPTDLEMFELQGSVSAGRLLPFVVGWSGVKELDLVPGGDPHPLPFDAAACAEWLADRPDLLGPIVSALVDRYAQHTEALGVAAKN